MNRKFVAKSNFVLRRVLNTKENIDILIEFIEVILNIKIKEATINPYLEKRKENLPAEENFGIADLRVKTNEGKEINIGIQIIDGEHVLTKIFLYFAQIHVYQLDHDIKRKIVETKTINILDFIVTKSKEYHSRMILDNKKSFEILSDQAELHIIELPKFEQKRNIDITLKEAWINYLKGENIEKAINKSEKIKKLDNALKKYWREETMD